MRMLSSAIPEGAKTILELLSNNGHQAFVVGGCVRDALMMKAPHDWDICTSASPDQVKSCIPTTIYDTGLRHGTVTVSMKDGMYEVTTFRIDGQYTDNRRPDSVVFTNDVVTDLSRRDFKMNAIAYSCDAGIVDPFGGIDDIRDRVISCVGDPDERFHEDALRIMRAIRFASTLGFSIAQETADSIRRNVHLLNNIAVERISGELVKTLSGDHAMDMMLSFPEVFCEIIPELRRCYGFNQNNRFHQYTVYDHIAHALGNYRGDDIYVKLALFFHDIGKPLCYTEDHNGGHFYGHGEVSRAITETVMERMRFDTRTEEEVCRLVQYHDSVVEPTEKTVRRWLNKVGEDTFRRLIHIRFADIEAHSPDTQRSRIEKTNQVEEVFKNIIEKNQCFSIKDMEIDGNDLIGVGFRQGKHIGDVLKNLLDKIIDGELQNEHDILITEAKRLL